MKICLKYRAELNPSVPVAGLPDDYLVSFIGMADVSESGRLLNKHDRNLKDVKFGFTRFTEGDVLFAKITPCMESGKGAFSRGLRNKIGFGSSEFHVLRNKKNGDAGFIYQVLQSPEFRLKAEARMSGSAGQKRVSSDFFEYYKTFIPAFLSSPFGQNQIDKLNSGGNREGLSYQQLRSFYVPWPKNSVGIEKSANSLHSIQSKLETELKNCDKMCLLKQALMSDLLTGKVRVKYEEEKTAGM